MGEIKFVNGSTIYVGPITVSVLGMSSDCSGLVIHSGLAQEAEERAKREPKYDLITMEELETGLDRLKEYGVIEVESFVPMPRCPHCGAPYDTFFGSSLGRYCLKCGNRLRWLPLPYYGPQKHRPGAGVKCSPRRAGRPCKKQRVRAHRKRG